MYYIRLIKLMFFKNFVYWTFLNEVSKSNSIIITLTLFLNLLFFCYPEIFIVYIYNVILNFFF
jgi:cell division protein FtsB